MNQKSILERWLQQLQKEEITPDALGLGTDRAAAMRHLRAELAKITEMETATPPQQTTTK
jgi:hypothetical protein